MILNNKKGVLNKAPLIIAHATRHCERTRSNP